MKDWAAGLEAHYALGTTTLAECWEATLTDGTIIRATADDAPLVIDGETYSATAGFSPSDVASGSELAPDNLEVEGFLASPAITEDDIKSGRWDYAAIRLFKVNRADPTMGKDFIRVGTLGEVRGGRSKFTAELRGLLQALSKRIGHVVTKECRHDLGETLCGINLASWAVTGTVTAVTDDRQFTDSGRAEAADYFTGGKLLWLTGANADRSMEVKQSSAAGVFKLHQAMPDTIVIGDTYSVHAGCTKRFDEDCVTKFSNGVNFGGAPHLPGQRIYKRGGVA
jgi:uncharacterized phage protein (TIGR02218 family)